MCIEMCIDMYLDMNADMCIDMRTEICRDICADVCMPGTYSTSIGGLDPGMFMNMCINVYVDMCM